MPEKYSLGRAEAEAAEMKRQMAQGQVEGYDHAEELAEDALEREANRKFPSDPKEGDLYEEKYKEEPSVWWKYSDIDGWVALPDEDVSDTHPGDMPNYTDDPYPFAK